MNKMQIISVKSWSVLQPCKAPITLPFQKVWKYACVHRANNMGISS